MGAHGKEDRSLHMSHRCQKEPERAWRVSTSGNTTRELRREVLIMQEYSLFDLYYTSGVSK